MRILFACLAAISLLASCSSKPSKKLIVLSRGTASVDEKAGTISVVPGSAYKDITIEQEKSGSMDFKISSAAGNATVNIPGDGVYIINTTKDTMVGSVVPLGAPKTESRYVKDEELRANIDSLTKIVTGDVSAEKKTFFLLPNTSVKVTDNLEAIIVAPYHEMTSFKTEKGKKLEVYRFYPIEKVREILHKQKVFAGEELAPEK
jgi:hypothetical protein